MILVNKFYKVSICLIMFLLFIISNNTKCNALSFKDSANNMCIFDIEHSQTEELQGDTIIFTEKLDMNSDYSGNILSLTNSSNIVVNKFRNIVSLSKEKINIAGEGDAIYAFSDNIEVDVKVKAAYFVGKNVSVDGFIDGDLVVVATNIILSDDLVVKGNITIKSPVQPTYPEGVQENLVTYIKTEEVEIEKKDNNKVFNVLEQHLSI